MRANPSRSKATSPRRTILSRLALAAFCVAVLCASFLLPGALRGPAKADTAFPTSVEKTLILKNLASKSGKPCPRTVPGVVGTPCSAGAMVGLAATSSVTLQPLSSRAGRTPLADVALRAQWLGAPQFRPPRTVA
ncbi:hypothetical protein [Bradyrhizobium sp.]|uniref:hypothetical protein n=1 Tax=Bradyrhizobium sp. TaxID=376 RepID=UPI0025C63AD7|nr:hypothetical protein [Bradyrhizobium sp.]